jgi:hypothetical protein
MRRRKMRPNHLVAVVGLIACFAFASVAVAGQTGNLKIKLVDKYGVTINGTVVAKMGSTTKSCNTSSGTCTLSSLTVGTWTLTARTPSGTAGGPVTKVVKTGETITFTVQVK